MPALQVKFGDKDPSLLEEDSAVVPRDHSAFYNSLSLDHKVSVLLGQLFSESKVEAKCPEHLPTGDKHLDFVNNPLLHDH